MEEATKRINAAAVKARDEYKAMESQLDMNTVLKLVTWWEKNYLTAGHSRLAYILMGKPLKGE